MPALNRTRGAGRSALLLGCLLLSAPAAAQVNIERLRSSDAAQGLSGALGANLALKRGNVDLLVLDGNAAALYHVGIHGVLLSGRGAFGEQDDERFAASGFGHLRWTAMWWSRVGTEVFTQLEYDEFVRLNLRALVGAGPRFVLFASQEVDLYAGTGYMIEYEKLDIPATDSHPQRVLAHRSTSYLTLALSFQEYLRLVQTVYVQPRFDRPSDVRVLDELTIEVAVAGQLKLTTTLGLRVDSKPPDSVEPLDLQLKNGLQVDF